MIISLTFLSLANPDAKETSSGLISSAIATDVMRFKAVWCRVAESEGERSEGCQAEYSKVDGRRGRSCKHGLK